MHPAASTLLAVLRAPLSPRYPLPPGESEAEWRSAARHAVAVLEPTFDRPDSFGGTLGGALLALAEGSLAPPLLDAPGRVRLLGDLLRNLADPPRINQGFKGTCAVASVETWLAETQPAEYARVVAALASPGGLAPLRLHGEIRRDEEHLEWHDAEARRSPVSRLFQVAAMEFAYPDLDYCNLADSHHTDCGDNTGTGIGLDAFDRLLEGLSGVEWARMSVEDAAKNATLMEMFQMDPAALPDLTRDAPAIIDASLEAGDAVFVTLQAVTSQGEGVGRAGEHPLLRLPHKVRILRWDGGRVWYDDPLDPSVPWMPDVDSRVETLDGLCSMQEADFFGLIVELSCRPAHMPVPC